MKLQELINKLHKYERGSAFANDLFNAVFIVISSIDSMVEDIKKEFFFDTITIGLKAYEKLLKIQPSVNATIDERRSAIRAKWRANGKNTIKLIQDICNSWKNGETLVNSKFQIQFINSYGVPSDLDSLKESIEEIIPAHRSYEFLFKYLLIENIDNVKTIEQMKEITLDMFAKGVEI